MSSSTSEIRTGSTSMTTKLLVSALCLAVAYFLPFLTGQIPQIGSMLAPMHLPVLICGFVCGGPWGLLVGAIAPLSRSLILGMPPLFPTAVAMSFELAAYGFFTGFFYNKIFKKQKLFDVFASLICAMIAGRIVWGVVMVILMGVSGGDTFTWAAFLSGAFIKAVPGIIVQIILVPSVVMALRKAKFIRAESPRT